MIQNEHGESSKGMWMGDIDAELNWIDVEGHVWDSMSKIPHVFVFWTREGLQILRNVEPPFTCEFRESDGSTRITFARPTMRLNDIVRNIVWRL